MKICTKLFLILFLIYGINIFSQIPNSGFESWTDPFTPVDWWTNNAPPAYTPVSRTTVAYMGSYAVQLQMVYFGSLVVPPLMQTNPFTVTEAHGSMMGYYQFYPNSSTEVLYIATWFMEDGQIIGAGAIDIGTGSSTYTPFNFDIYYSRSGAVPDSAYIWIGITDTSGNPPLGGGYAYLDELSFGPPTDVEEISSTIPDDYSLKQNYPNPFNPSTTIKFSVPFRTNVSIKIYDLLGVEIKTLIKDELVQGIYNVEFDAGNITSGIYFYIITAGNFRETKKMILLK